MNDKHDHLSEEQINSLLDAELTSRDRSSTPTTAAASRRHLELCADCKSLFEGYAEINRRLLGLRGGAEGQDKDKCPTETDLCGLALENIPNAVSEQIMKHVMKCDRCNAKVQQIVQDLVSEPSESEQFAVENLKSSGQEWQAHLAKRLSRTDLHFEKASSPNIAQISQRSLRPGVALRSLLTAAALLLIAFSATGLYVLLHKPSVDQLLTSAYSARRTLEFRISGASYARMPVKRGDEDPSWPRPSSLLEAESRIEQDFPQHANDAKWLAARGRAALLNHDFEGAIQNLKTSLGISPKLLSARIDLASAYSEHAIAKKRPWEHADAVEILMNVLREQPKNQVAIFNLGLILERQYLFNQAAEQWRNYLEIDSNGGWANEAREHLKQDEDGIKKLNWQPPLLGGPQVAAEKLSHSSVISDRLDQRSEDYLREATIRWLPQAFPLNTKSSLAAEYQSALGLLATVLQEGHRDAWLHDLLSDANSSEFPIAISLLAQSVSANEVGDYEQATRVAHLAAAHFLAARNPAGQFRSQLEEVYSLRLSHDAARCDRIGGSLLREMNETSYAWTIIQTTLERQECLNMRGELGRALSLSNVNLAHAQVARYPQLYLRAVFFAADTEASLGDTKSAWRRTSDGLASSWDIASSPMRTYSLDTELDFLADQTGRTRFDEIVLNEALATLSTDRDILMRAMANGRLAQVALAADDLNTAAEHFQIALNLFSIAPETSVTASHRMESEIGLARVELQRREFSAAAQRLRKMQSSIHDVSNRYLQIDFFQTLGEANLRLNQEQDADKALCFALELTESALGTLHSDNDRLEWDHAAGKTYRTLVESKLQQHDIIGALEFWEWYRAATIRREKKVSLGGFEVKSSEENSFGRGCPWRALHLVHDQLASLSETIVISYAVLTSGIAAWAYDNRGIRFHWISRDVMETSQLVDRFTALCAQPDSDRQTLLQLGRALYDMLLAPFDKDLTPSRLIVLEPDGVLWSTPFPALIRPDGNYLSDFNSLSEFPGLYYRNLLRPSRPFDSTAAALAVSEEMPVHFREVDLPALPSAATEVRAIADQFPNTLLLRNQEATLHTLSDQLQKAVVFHFAGHAIQTGDGAALLLASSPRESEVPSILGATALDSMHFPNLSLAVLSACSTEKGADENGLLDSGSLARAFMRGGVRYVIASRWAIDSAATEETMLSFYDNLFQGLPPPTALRLAMFHVRKQHSTSHPYYWAAFTSFGLT